MIQTWLVDLLIQVSAATLIGLLLVLVLRKSPAARYAACSAVFLAIALSPISSFVVARSGWTSLRIPVLKASVEKASQVPDSLLDTIQTLSSPGSVIPAGYLTPTLPVSAGSTPNQPGWISWSIAAWAVGALLLTFRLLACAVSVRRIVRGAQPSDHPAVAQAAHVLKERLGVRKLPQILLGKIVSPFAVAWPKPAILLPESLPHSIDPEDLGVVLAHELGHIEQGHGAMLAVQRTAQTLYWPHPLVHWLSREMSKAREEVCDNFVLHVASPCRLARTLLLVAETAPAVSNPAVAGLLLPHWRLEQRVSGLLDPKRKRSIRISRILMTTLNLSVLSLCAVAAGVQLTSAQSTVVVKQGGKTYVLHASKKHPVTVKVRTKTNTQNIVVTEQGAKGSSGVTFSDAGNVYVIADPAEIPTRTIKVIGQKAGSEKARLNSGTVIASPDGSLRVLEPAEGKVIELDKAPLVLRTSPSDSVVKSSRGQAVTTDKGTVVLRSVDEPALVTSRDTTVRLQGDVVKARSLTLKEGAPLTIVRSGDLKTEPIGVPVTVGALPSKTITLDKPLKVTLSEPSAGYTIVQTPSSKGDKIDLKVDTTLASPKVEFVPARIDPAYSQPLTGVKSYRITQPSPIRWIADPSQSSISSRELLRQAKAKAIREGKPALAKRIQRLLDGLGK